MFAVAGVSGSLVDTVPRTTLGPWGDLAPNGAKSPGAVVLGRPLP